MTQKGKRLNTARPVRKRVIFGIILFIALIVMPMIYFIVISPNVEFEVEKSQTYPVATNSQINYKKATATLFGFDITNTLKESGAEVNFKKLGEYRIEFSTWLSTKKCCASIFIEDWDAPEIFLIGDLEIWLDNIENYQEEGFFAKDNYDDGAELTSRIVVTMNQIDESTYEVVYNVTDATGNPAHTVKRTIHIVPEDVENLEQQVLEDDPNSTYIYLTFDDGPSENVTPQILDILKDRNVPATFFVLGYETGSEKEELVKREFNEGHTVALHGYSHNYETIYQSIDSLMNNFYAIQDLVRISTGYTSTIIRFPGGSSNTVSAKYCEGVMSDAVKRVTDEGLVYVDWNVDSEDASGNNVPPDHLYSQVTSGIVEGRSNVVLMHDSSTKETTAEALNDIIDYCEEHDYIFRAISEDTPVVVHHRVNN